MPELLRFGVGPPQKLKLKLEALELELLNEKALLDDELTLTLLELELLVLELLELLVALLRLLLEAWETACELCLRQER